MIQSIQQGLLADGVTVSIARLCAWFGVPRRTVCYTPVKAAPKVDPRFAEPIKAMIEAEPSFGYRTVAWLLGFNKNTVQRIFQLKGWQVRKRAIGLRPRIQAVPSVATAPNERWSTDLARVWTGKDGWPPPTFAPSRHGKLARCAGAPRAGHGRLLWSVGVLRAGRMSARCQGPSAVRNAPAGSPADDKTDWGLVNQGPIASPLR